MIISADLCHSRHPNNRRLALPLRKCCSLSSIGIETREDLPIVVENPCLEVMVFAPFVFSELGAFALTFHLEVLSNGNCR
jgi:hypothetical protein